MKPSSFTLIAVIGGLLVSSQSQATVLSDNLLSSAGSTETVADSSWVAAEFSTDSSSYVLSSAVLLLSNPIHGAAELDLYNDSIGQPGTMLGALTAPAVFSSGISEASFGGNGLSLGRKSSYWLVLKALSGDFEWTWSNTSSGMGVGFSSNWGASDDAGASWFTGTSQPMMERISADAVTSGVPEPSTIALLAAGFLSIAIKSARSRMKQN